MRLFRSLALLTCCTLGSTACCTTAVQIGYWKQDPTVPVYIMGGTVAYFGGMGAALTSENSEASMFALLLFDLPFSFAADILLLPLCIYEQIERTTWSEDEFIARLDDPDPEDRRAAAKALGKLGGTATSRVEALARALGDEDPTVRCAALEALAELGPRSTPVAPAVLARLGDTEGFVRVCAARALRGIPADPTLVVPALLAATEDQDPLVRVNAIATLESLDRREPAVLERLELLRHDGSPQVREAAEKALQRRASQP